MENKRVEDKIDKLHENLTEVLVILERNTVNIAEHIRRTNLLEQRVEQVDTHVKNVNGALKLLGVLSTLFGIYAAIKAH